MSFGRPQKLRPDQKTLTLSLVQEGRSISISEVARTFNVHPATIHRCLNGPHTPKPALFRSDAWTSIGDPSFPSPHVAGQTLTVDQYAEEDEQLRWHSKAEMPAPCFVQP